MKGHLLLFLLNFTLLFSSFGQITVPKETFPQVGDTLFTLIDNLPSNIDVLAVGGNQTWDFTSLQAPFIRQTVTRIAAAGEGSSSFLDAGAVMDLEDQVEGYFKFSDEAVRLIGFFGMDPLDFGVEVSTRINPPLVERRAPLNFFDVNQSEANISFPFSADDLPGNVLDQLPITPDSLRVRIAIERLDVVDAWGTIMIPGGIYDVLREKRFETRETRLDVKVSVLPWQDVTDLIPNTDGILGMDTIITYTFYNDVEKEPIAIVQMNNNETQVEQVEYKANDITSNVQDVRNLKPGVYAFPNPAIVNVRFEFSNLPPGNYELKIFNILGIEQWARKYEINNSSRTEKVDISSLRKGTYLYTLTDAKGNSITTRRLLVVRP